MTKETSVINDETSEVNSADGATQALNTLVSAIQATNENVAAMVQRIDSLEARLPKANAEDDGDGEPENEGDDPETDQNAAPEPKSEDQTVETPEPPVIPNGVEALMERIKALESAAASKVTPKVATSTAIGSGVTAVQAIAPPHKVNGITKYAESPVLHDLLNAPAGMLPIEYFKQRLNEGAYNGFTVPSEAERYPNVMRGWGSQ